MSGRYGIFYEEKEVVTACMDNDVARFFEGTIMVVSFHRSLIIMTIGIVTLSCDALSQPIAVQVNGLDRYCAHTASAVPPDGFHQEATIKSTWNNVFVDFDDFPVTPPDGNPDSSAQWIYTTAQENPAPGFYMTDYDCGGWRTASAYPAPNDTIYNCLYQYLCTDNTSHIGYSTYGYLEIDAANAVRGNCLRACVTGAVNSTGTYGELVTTKQHYLDFLAFDFRFNVG